MTEGIREGYDILWQTYKEAQKESPENLIKVFQVKLNINEDTARRAYNTYTILSGFADFSATDGGVIPTPSPQPTPLASISTSPTPMPSPQTTLTLTTEQFSALTSQKRELGVNINIQVTLPETTDADVYDKIFAALKKHFFSG
jgi:hypothetical protein